MIADIIIDELLVSTCIGCMPSEQEVPQPLIISAAIQYDISEVVKHDNIEDAVNYASICEAIKSYIESRSFHLVETVAAHIFPLIFSDIKVMQASLFIYKPEAITYTKRVGVKVMQKNPNYTDQTVSEKSLSVCKNTMSLNWED